MDRRRFLLSFCYWGALAAILYLIFFQLLPCLLPFLIGCFIAMLLHSSALRVHRYTRLPYRLSAFLTASFFYLFTGLLIWWLGALLLSQLSSFLQVLPSYYFNDLQPTLMKLSERLNLNNFYLLHNSFLLSINSLFFEKIFPELLTSLSGQAFAWLGNFFSSLPSHLISCFFTIFSSFFLLMDYDQIGQFFLNQIPHSLVSSLKETKNFFGICCKGVLRAYFLVLCITFFEVSLGLWILGIDYYLLIGLMIALLDILPVLGSGTVLIPWGVYLLLAGRYPLSAGIFLLYAVVTVMRSMIEPRIVGKKLGLHPLATVIAMYLGLKCCGVPGLMFAPFLLTLLVHLKRCGCLRIFR